MMKLSCPTAPIVKIPSPRGVELYMKREDLISSDMPGNKYWKLYYNLLNYMAHRPPEPLLITFGGAFSNHIAATAAAGKLCNIPTLGIIRGEEIERHPERNPTLQAAAGQGMQFRFVSREAYRDKVVLTRLLQAEFPQALIIPEGGTNPLAVEGIQHMLGPATRRFDVLCTAAGTGGTMAGLLKYADEGQKVLGFSVVKDRSLPDMVKSLSGKENFNIFDASFGGYGKINESTVRFINNFYDGSGILLDPVYTGKMMQSLTAMIAEGAFAEGTRILAFHTGGLQGIAGANSYLKSKNQELIKN